MTTRKNNYHFHIVLGILIIAYLSFGFKENNKKGTSNTEETHSLKKTLVSGKNGDSYRFYINNINLPLNDKGKIAAVNIPPVGSGGKFGGKDFLFSSGFYLSGYTNGKLWAFGNASSSLIENTVSGPAEDPNDPRAQLYVLNKEDQPFGASWQEWKDAVALGADFYDGDGDGQYNPVDRNGNGIWDPDEDRPDIVGDETVWCIYNDGQPGAQRTNFPGIEPQGVDIKQTIFGFASKGALGNIIFLRYRIKNTGLKADTLNDVYFGVWSDPDIGGTAGYKDDLVGVDVPKNAGYVYNDGPDAGYGVNPPCFMTDFFSGPIAYIADSTYTDNNGNGAYDEGVDTPIDTAYSLRGQIMGVKAFPGATNLGISSFIHYQQSDPTLGDPSTEVEARNYMLGLDKLGNPVDPCDWPLSKVFGGVDCSTINNKFWYSGDPVTKVGWINTKPTDQRMMQNTGPFKLIKDQELEIVVAYIVGQGSSALSSITEARKIDDGAQFIFDNNFAAPSPPPAVTPTVETGEDFIDLSWDTPKQVDYKNTTAAWDLRFEGYIVYAYKTNATVPTVNGQQNSEIIATYDLNNFIQDVYKEDGQTGGIELLYPKSTNQLDSLTYSDPSTGRIRLRITQDPFTGGNLVKGKPYYFAITSYALNYEGLRLKSDPTKPIGTSGDYYLSKDALTAESENIAKITKVIMGADLYSPPQDFVDAEKSSGGSSGKLQYDVVDKTALTGDKYAVTFTVDSSTSNYSAFWNLKNLTTGQMLLDSANYFLYGKSETSYQPTDGFIVKLMPETPALGNLTYELSNNWIDTTITQYNYLNTDVAGATRILGIGGNLSNLNGNYVKADRLRRIELRFGESGKAYRYLNGFIGNNNATQQRFFKYAEAVTAADTIGKGVVGEWDAAAGHAKGYVDVPFTAWLKDFATGEEKQLSVGFIEKRADLGGNPDGKWDPGTNLAFSGEYIFIFDTTYDANGGQRMLKGGTYINSATDWADLNGAGVSKGAFYKIPADAPISATERKLAESPFFNTLYAVGIQRKNKSDFYSAGDKIVIDVSNYPYSPLDIYTFETKKNGDLTTEEEKTIFDKVNVFPNPLYGFNAATSYTNSSPDEPFVTFSNLPEEIIIKIYTLSGSLVRTLTTSDKSTAGSPFLQWNLQNESGLRVASGLYIAIVSSPKFGDKILKFSLILPQKQIQKF